MDGQVATITQSYPAELCTAASVLYSYLCSYVPLHLAICTTNIARVDVVVAGAATYRLQADTRLQRREDAMRAVLLACFHGIHAGLQEYTPMLTS